MTPSIFNGNRAQGQRASDFPPLGINFLRRSARFSRRLNIYSRSRESSCRFQSRSYLLTSATVRPSSWLRRASIAPLAESERARVATRCLRAASAFLNSRGDVPFPLPAYVHLERMSIRREHNRREPRGARRDIRVNQTLRSEREPTEMRISPTLPLPPRIFTTIHRPELREAPPHRGDREPFGLQPSRSTEDPQDSRGEQGGGLRSYRRHLRWETRAVEQRSGRTLCLCLRRRAT